jgi:hypothetical protein
VLGAAAGVAASWLMGPVQSWMSRLSGPEAKRREQRAQRASGEPATDKVAGIVAQRLGIDLSPEQKQLGGQLVHYATGACWGAVFGALHRDVPAPLIVAGLAYGLALWVAEDEGLVSLLGLTPPPTAYPITTHEAALVSHLVYGAATAGSYQLFERAAARI